MMTALATFWPQILIVSLTLMSVGIAIERYGQAKKPDKYDLSDVLIGPALSFTILYYGGFFAAIGFAP